MLRLTRPDDYVMDAKGEMIFRRRPVYWALEDITIARMREGSIADDIADRLVATGTPVVIMDRLPARDVAFVERNYVPICPSGGLICIAGQQPWLPTRAGEPSRSMSRCPPNYAIVTPTARRGYARWRAVQRRAAPCGAGTMCSLHPRTADLR